MTDQVLLLVAIKTDQPNIANRIRTILAATQAFTPDSDSAAFAKPVSEITADDYLALEALLGEKPTEGLRIGSLVAMDAIRPALSRVGPGTGQHE